MNQYPPKCYKIQAFEAFCWAFHCQFSIFQGFEAWNLDEKMKRWKDEKVKTWTDDHWMKRWKIVVVTKMKRRKDEIVGWKKLWSPNGLDEKMKKGKVKFRGHWMKRLNFCKNPVVTKPGWNLSLCRTPVSPQKLCSCSCFLLILRILQECLGPWTFWMIVFQ